jgi:hypothetical protein
VCAHSHKLRGFSQFLHDSSKKGSNCHHLGSLHSKSLWFPPVLSPRTPPCRLRLTLPTHSDRRRPLGSFFEFSFSRSLFFRFFFPPFHLVHTSEIETPLLERSSVSANGLLLMSSLGWSPYFHWDFQLNFPSLQWLFFRIFPSLIFALLHTFEINTPLLELSSTAANGSLSNTPLGSISSSSIRIVQVNLTIPNIQIHLGVVVPPVLLTQQLTCQVEFGCLRFSG